MSRAIAFAVPGDLATPTGGYAYDRRMIAELRALGWAIETIDLGAGFPAPTAEALAAAQAKLGAVADGRAIVVDGLAYGVMAAAARQLRERHKVIALVHHPLALETGLAAHDAARLRHAEREALAAAHAVIVTSAATARLLTTDYGVAAERISVAPPGIDPAAVAHGSDDGVIRLLSVGAIVPRKGHDVLVAALARLSDLPWRLTIAGAVNRDPACAERLQADLCSRGLTDRVSLAGAVSDERLTELYRAADVFVLASRFEGYGMAFAKAMAHGLAVVGTTAGAIPETIPAEAALLVAPDDADALARALRRLIGAPQERRRLAAEARKAARALPSWRAAALAFARALEAVQ